MTLRGPLLAGAGAIVMAALLVVTLWPDRPAHTLPRRDPDRVYRALLAGDFSDLGLRDGLEFAGVHGMLPPGEAERERHWLVYAGFDGPADRHRIAYQIAMGQKRAELDKVFSKSRRCVRYLDAAWECVGSLGDVYVKGDVMCLERDCTATRRQAETLLHLGIRHLQDVFASL